MVGWLVSRGWSVLPGLSFACRSGIWKRARHSRGNPWPDPGPHASREPGSKCFEVSWMELQCWNCLRLHCALLSLTGMLCWMKLIECWRLGLQRVWKRSCLCLSVKVSNFEKDPEALIYIYIYFFFYKCLTVSVDAASHFSKCRVILCVISPLLVVEVHWMESLKNVLCFHCGTRYVYGEWLCYSRVYLRHTFAWPFSMWVSIKVLGDSNFAWLQGRMLMP